MCWCEAVSLLKLGINLEFMQHIELVYARQLPVDFDVEGQLASIDTAIKIVAAHPLDYRCDGFLKGWCRAI